MKGKFEVNFKVDVGDLVIIKEDKHSNFCFSMDTTLSRVTQRLDMSDVALRHLDQPFVINDYHTELQKI